MLVITAQAQQKFEPQLNLTKDERTISVYVEADLESVTETGKVSTHLKAPVFLNYNINNIRLFSAEPLTYTGLFKKSIPDLTMLVKGYFTESNNNRLEAGLMYAEIYSESYEDGIKAESVISGYCENNLEIYFHVPDFEQQINEGKRDLKYQLEITCKGTSNVQKDVHGKVQFAGMTITDGLKLDVRIQKPSVQLEDVPLNITTGTSAWEEFIHEYFRNLPAIDVNDINEFLMNPAAQRTFPFYGYYEWKSHKYRMNYSGKITLDGTTVRDFIKQ